MHFDFIARIVGAVIAWLVLVYYRVRHPFTWKKRFIDSYRASSPTEVMYLDKGTQGRMIIGGDCPVEDIAASIDVLHSFSFGNLIVPNSKGEYISVNRKKGEA